MMSAAAARLGAMPMPADFIYRNTFLHGRPKHQKYDAFWAKHPPMSLSRRAKIFSPFDALAGFDEAIAGKEVGYCRRKHLSEEAREALDRRLQTLRGLYFQARKKQVPRPHATVTCFIPCTDIDSEWFGLGGRYEDISGPITALDCVTARTITIGQRVIRLADVSDIRF